MSVLSSSVSIFLIVNILERCQPLLQHAERYPNLHWTLYGVRSFPLLPCFAAWHQIYGKGEKRMMKQSTWYVVLVLVVH
jgi:hypothetical protein